MFARYTHEDAGGALLAATRRTTRAVDEEFWRGRTVEVDDRVHRGDIETTRGDVGDHEDGHAVVLELGEVDLAVGGLVGSEASEAYLHGAVDGLGFDPVERQERLFVRERRRDDGNEFRVVARGHEDEGALGVRNDLAKQVDECRHLLVLIVNHGQ